LPDDAQPEGAGLPEAAGDPPAEGGAQPALHRPAAGAAHRLQRQAGRAARRAATDVRAQVPGPGAADDPDPEARRQHRRAQRPVYAGQRRAEGIAPFRAKAASRDTPKTLMLAGERPVKHSLHSATTRFHEEPLRWAWSAASLR